MDKKQKILVLGATGMVGQALTRKLASSGFDHVLRPSRETLDLTRQADVFAYFAKEKPDYVFLAAAKVGGIKANNTYRADFIYENLLIQNNVFGAAAKSETKKLLFYSSSCVYPKEALQPIKEEALLTGPLEPTNEPFAVAKIAGIKTAESFRRQYGLEFFSVIPANLYGPGDNFDPENSHVVAGLIRRVSEAKRDQDKQVSIWGSGKPLRDFLYVDDLAEASLQIMSLKEAAPDWTNVGTGKGVSIAKLARIVKEAVGFEGELVFDSSRPDGMMKKVLDVSKIQTMGWSPQVSLKEGVKRTVESFKL